MVRPEPPGQSRIPWLSSPATRLAAAQRELGDGLDAFITTRTPWNLAEARALIAFAAQAGLQPEGLTPAVAVGLGRLLAATAVLGELYTAEVEQVNDITH